MNHITSKITRALIAALLTLSVAPNASLAHVDLRSPDARDAARSGEARDYTDLRSPDARDAGRPAPIPSPAPRRAASQAASTGT